MQDLMVQHPTALIAEDEPHLAKYLSSRMATLWPELDIRFIVDNGDDALKLIEQESPDIAFLDIRMPGLTGLEVAERMSRPCRIVFVTAYDQYALAAFEQAAIDYLLKPVSDERLSNTIARLKKDCRPHHADTLSELRRFLVTAHPPTYLRWIRAQCGSNVRLVAVEEICYFQASDKYTLVVTAEAELLIRTPIKELSEQLDPELFWQIHRGTLVNCRQIVAARHDEQGRINLKLRNRPETLAVSRGHAHLFRQM
ncbi:MAG: response regulator of the LytR/AlgR family [Proteobacteria bacterium]|nr:response regulator of the LytR/AlgR family [Pseudomonadota bacterium]